MKMETQYPRNHWYAILRSQDLQDKPLPLERFSEHFVVWRNQSKKSVSCFVDRCSHRGAALSLGRIKDNCLVCPYHGLTFNGQGHCTLVPSNSSTTTRHPSPRLALKNFPVREAHGLIWLWWGEALAELPPLPWFTELDASTPFVEIEVKTPAGFCRFMESNLDFAHFHFVHPFFKIPGLGPVTEPFECEQDGNLIRVWGTLSQGTGSAEGVNFDGAVLFPGQAIYDVPTTGQTRDRSLIAASPINENHTWFSLRVYASHPGRFKLSLFKHWLFLRAIFPIIHYQDSRIMRTQPPQGPGEHQDLHVLTADQGVVQYLRLWRQALRALPHPAESPDTAASPPRTPKIGFESNTPSDNIMF